MLEMKVVDMGKIQSYSNDFVSLIKLKKWNFE